MDGENLNLTDERSFRGKQLTYWETPEGEDLSIHEKHCRVVTACRHLSTGAGQSLHQSGRPPVCLDKNQSSID